jgi:RNA polymerase sigma-70 factor (ECF subfamily)
LWRSLRRLGIPQRDLEDVTHDVLLQVFSQLDRYDTERPIRPWLFGFAFRIASDYRRSARHRFEKLDPEIDGADPAPAVVDRLVRAEALGVGYDALSCLELPWRAVFILHELDGCTAPEIARSLETPLNTVYSRLRAAREQFNAAVRRIRQQRGFR